MGYGDHPKSRTHVLPRSLEYTVVEVLTTCRCSFTRDMQNMYVHLYVPRSTQKLNTKSPLLTVAPKRGRTLLHGDSGERVTDHTTGTERGSS